MIDVTTLSFVLLSILFGTASILYRKNKDTYARYFSFVGFSTVFVACIVLTGVLTMQERYDVWLFGVSFGIYLAFNAAAKVFYREQISQRLTETMALFVILLAPFYIIQNIDIVLMELMAKNIQGYSEFIGVNTVLSENEPGLTNRLTFDNSGYIFVNWACIGVEFAILYSAFILPANISIGKKLFGVVLATVTVYIANVSRMMFTVVVMDRDMFGPLLTDGNTLQWSFYISEYLVSQTFIIAIAILVFIVLMRTVPETEAVFDGFMDQHDSISEHI
jgi:exosortase/archaeosortase family protein